MNNFNKSLRQAAAPLATVAAFFGSAGCSDAPAPKAPSIQTTVDKYEKIVYNNGTKVPGNTNQRRICDDYGDSSYCVTGTFYNNRADSMVEVKKTALHYDYSSTPARLVTENTMPYIVFQSTKVGWLCGKVACNDSQKRQVATEMSEVPCMAKGELYDYVADGKC